MGATQGDAVLKALERGPRYNRDIAEATGLSRSAVSVLLSSLKRDGLVEQEDTRRTKAGSRWSLTADGERIVTGVPVPRLMTDAEIRRREQETLARMLDFTPRAWKDERGIWLKAGTCPMRITEDEARGLIGMLEDVLS